MKKTTKKKPPKKKARRKAHSVHLQEQLEQSEAQLRCALATVSNEDRQLYLERLFIGDVGKMSQRKRKKMLEAFFKFASIGFLSDAVFSAWAKDGE